MKKFKSFDKKGFTLLEMVITIAIITIAASAVGVAVSKDISKYEKYLEEERNIEANGGWEYEARMLVDSYKPEASDDDRFIRDRVDSGDMSGGSAGGGSEDPIPDPEPIETEKPETKPSVETTKATEAATTATEATTTTTVEATTATTAKEESSGSGTEISGSTNNWSSAWGSGGQVGLTLPEGNFGKNVVIKVVFPGSASLKNVSGWNWQSNGSYVVKGSTVEITINELSWTRDFGIQVEGKNINEAKLISVKVL